MIVTKFGGASLLQRNVPCTHVDAREFILKEIALVEHLLLLEMRSKDVETRPQFIGILRDFCKRKNINPSLLSQRDGRLYLGVHSAASLDGLESEMAGCVEARLQTNMAIITLVGDGIGSDCAVSDKVLAIVQNSCDGGTRMKFVSDDHDSVQLTLAVRQKDARRIYETLHHELFQPVDPSAFTPVRLDRTESKNDGVVNFTLDKNAVLSSYRFESRSQAASSAAWSDDICFRES